MPGLTGGLTPRHMEDVFVGTRRLLNWNASLVVLMGQLREHGAARYGTFLDTNNLLKTLESVRQEVSSAIPYGLCDCEERPCPLCEGRRWLSAKRALQHQVSSEIDPP